MKTTQLPTIQYYHRGQVRRNQFDPMQEAYSANSENGKPLTPWRTRLECIADARAKGAQARFNYGVVAK